MEKLVVGPSAKDAVSLDAPGGREPAGDRAQPRAQRRGPGRDRARSAAPRTLIQEIRATGARIRLITDGDLSAGIAAAVVGSGVHAVMGTGGAPEGVLTAAAMRCLNGEIFASPGRQQAASTRSAAARWASRTSRGSTPRRSWRRATNLIFAATGVTDGTLMQAASASSATARAPSSLVMQTDPAARPIHRHDPHRAEPHGASPILDGLQPGARTSSPSPPRRFIGFTGLHAGDAVPAAVLPAARRYRRRARSRCGRG